MLVVKVREGSRGSRVRASLGITRWIAQRRGGDESNGGLLSGFGEAVLARRLDGAEC